MRPPSIFSSSIWSDSLCRRTLLSTSSRGTPVESAVCIPRTFETLSAAYTTAAYPALPTHALAKLVLALVLIGHRRIVAHGLNETRHLQGTEALLEAFDGLVGVLEHVVQDRGGHGVIRIVIAVVHQRGDLDRVHHERGAVGLATLSSVLLHGPYDRRLREREVARGAERALGLGRAEDATPQLQAIRESDVKVGRRPGSASRRALRACRGAPAHVAIAAFACHPELERDVGAVLFIRTTRHVELTPAGAALLSRAPVALSEVDVAWSGWPSRFPTRDAVRRGH